MRYLIFSIAFLLINFLSYAQSQFIHVDQFGYYNDAPKVAVLSNPQTGYNSALSYTAPANLEVIDNNTMQVVFTASPTVWNGGSTHSQSGDSGWWFDFSSVTQSGEYYVNDPVNNEQSAVFVINDNPYLEVLKASVKMFYYNRCNMPKTAPSADANWVDGDNFNNALQDYNCRYIYDSSNATLEKDLSGGWFDAGDYNKYIPFVYNVAHNLLSAYEMNPNLFTDNWNIPESGNGLPDLLDELKWELDWMMKMANPDGSVHIKMGSQNHSENASSPPSANVDQRFYGPTCTAASVTLASNFAHAAVVFNKIIGYENYTNSLQTTSIAAYNYALNAFNNGTLQFDCDDGSIVSGDADLNADEQLESLIVAAVYLFELTGDIAYSNFVVNNAPSIEPLSNGFWGPYKVSIQDALLRYGTLPNADAAFASTVTNSLAAAVSNNWDGFFGMNDWSLYRDHIPDWSYHWGSNKPKAGYGCLNQTIAQYGIGNDAINQQQKAEEVLHSFHGLNPLGVVYLSNMYGFGAERSCNEIYHLWFQDGTDYDNAQTSLYGPAPGYVPGGPNSYFGNTNLVPPYGQPPMKSYLDYNDGWPLNSWEITEPSITYQAMYVRLIANVIGLRGYPDPTTMTANVAIDDACINVYPNPASNYFVIHGELCNYRIEILNSAGQLVQSIPNVGAEQIIDISTLGLGLYFVRMENLSNNALSFQTILKQ